MNAKLTITLAQMTQSVGDLQGNADAMIAVYQTKQDSDLIVFPELQLVGYPPEDLVLKPAVVERADLELRRLVKATAGNRPVRSEEHTSELQSRPHLVCRLLLEKKKRENSCWNPYEL